MVYTTKRFVEKPNLELANNMFLLVIFSGMQDTLFGKLNTFE
jgi:hypothetical protein